MDRLTELGDFLRAKRAHAAVPEPSVAGLNRRRVPGMRREEVAHLALISTAYYTKLERGKAAGISGAVLNGLTTALGLSDEERAYVARLIPVTGEQVARGAVSADDEVTPVLQRVLDAVDAPAHVQTDGCDLVATNALGRALYPFHFETERPNTVRFLFTDPRAREFYVDWEQWADQGVYYLRSALARQPRDRALTELIRELTLASADFREAWETHEVEYAPVGVRRLQHPEVGRLDLEFQNLQVAGQPSLRVIVYTAEPGSPTAAGLARLLQLGGYQAAR